MGPVDRSGRSTEYRVQSTEYRSTECRVHSTEGSVAGTSKGVPSARGRHSAALFASPVSRNPGFLPVALTWREATPCDAPRSDRPERERDRVPQSGRSNVLICTRSRKRKWGEEDDKGRNMDFIKGYFKIGHAGWKPTLQARLGKTGKKPHVGGMHAGHAVPLAEKGISGLLRAEGPQLFQRKAQPCKRGPQSIPGPTG